MNETATLKPERKKQRKHLPKVDKEFIHELGSMTGFRKEEVRLAYAACMKIIRDQLSAGKEVYIPHVGKFVFIMAKPRKIPQRGQGGRVPALDLGERLMLKFKVHQRFKHHVRFNVKPKVVRRHQRWSDVRKAAKMANQILSVEQTASPSIQPGKEPSTSPAREHNTHNPGELPDMGGTTEAPGCKPDSNGTSPTSPIAPLAEPIREIESEPAECETKLQASAIGTGPQSEAL